MSEYSVKNISKLPMLFPEKRGGLARSLMLKVLAKLQVGSLTLKEQGETLVFGSQADPAAPHAEVHVHDSDLYRRILTGGGIAAGLALYNRDQAKGQAGGPTICYQLLEIPEIDDRLNTPSMLAFQDTPFWNRPNAVFSWQHYFSPEFYDKTNKSYSHHADEIFTNTCKILSFGLLAYLQTRT